MDSDLYMVSYDRPIWFVSISFKNFVPRTQSNKLSNLHHEPSPHGQYIFLILLKLVGSFQN